MMKWARGVATQRGFGPGTTKQIQIVMDGEKCFAKRLRRLFPKAIRYPQYRKQDLAISTG